MLKWRIGKRTLCKTEGELSPVANNSPECASRPGIQRQLQKVTLLLGHMHTLTHTNAHSTHSCAYIYTINISLCIYIYVYVYIWECVVCVHGSVWSVYMGVFIVCSRECVVCVARSVLCV